MPPVNRKNPVRAKSSESDYSLMEFMQEFPNDDACLDWLWRNRYSILGMEFRLSLDERHPEGGYANFCVH